MQNPRSALKCAPTVPGRHSGSCIIETQMGQFLQIFIDYLTEYGSFTGAGTDVGSCTDYVSKMLMYSVHGPIMWKDIPTSALVLGAPLAALVKNTGHSRKTYGPISGRLMDFYGEIFLCEFCIQYLFQT